MLFKLLTAPISAPIAGFKFVLEQIAELAERELYDEDRIREALLLLQLELEEGQISEEEYVARERELLDRLRAARADRRGGLGWQRDDARPGAALEADRVTASVEYLGDQER
jgi:hypothetical protein